MLGQKTFSLREVLPFQVRLAKIFEAAALSLAPISPGGPARRNGYRQGLLPALLAEWIRSSRSRWRPRSVGKNLGDPKPKGTSQARLGFLTGAGRGLGGRSSGSARGGVRAPMISSRVLLVVDTTTSGAPVEGRERYSAGSGEEAGSEAAAALPCAASSSS